VDLFDAGTGFAMEVGGSLLFFLVVVALCFAAVAVPPMLIRWAVRQIRAKCFRRSVDVLPGGNDAAESV
jgi:hypothetical protein